MGDQDFDRRDQRRPNRRQSAGVARRAFARLLGTDQLFLRRYSGDAQAGLGQGGVQRRERQLDRCFGAPGFFRPRLGMPLVVQPGTPEALSLYDTSPLRKTLGEMI